MSGIKAIETTWNGYRFRSRTEARWAIFFDALGLNFEYEKEGFVLNDGEKYLPDFWMPDLNAWIEIKGKQPEHDVLDLLHRFRVQVDNRVYLLYGEVWHPGARNGIIVFDEDQHYDDSGWQWSECPHCHQIAIAYYGAYIHFLCECADSITRVLGISSDPAEPGAIVEGFALAPPSRRISDAFIAAREARFEFGAKPSPRQVNGKGTRR